MSDTTPRRRAPAFQFYADDFLAGTLDLSQAEVGAYVRLLCHQWNRGSIPVEPEKQQRLAGGSVSVDVLAKFRLHEDGTLKNERLEAVRAASDAFRDKQAEKGRKSAEKRANMANRGSTVVQPGCQPNGQPEANSPSPSPSPSPIPNAIDVSTPQAEGGVGETPKPPQPAGGGGVLIPTRQELEARAAMIGLPLREVDKFEAHYGANGWTVAGTPMASWTHAMVKWKLKWEEINGHGNAGQRGGGQPTAAERRNALIAGADATQRQAELTAERERREQQDPDWVPI